MKLFLLFLTLTLFTPVQLAAQFKKLTSYVNPFIGTDGFGHTFPGASRPFGMVQLSPDTRTSGWENCSGYHSSNPTIIGFSHTHLSGTGAADYGDIMFMATNSVQMTAGPEAEPLKGYRSAYTHESERAVPGYYRVMLADHGIQAEMTATTRCGFHKYTFPANGEAVIITDLVHGIADKVTDSEIEITGDNVISGYRRSGGWAKDHVIYFYAEFSKPFIASGLTDKNGNEIKGNKSKSPKGIKSWVKFKLRNYDAVLVKVGISTVSVENAKLNLSKEITDFDFLKIMTEAKEHWESELQKIVVEGGTKADKVNFYTSLYHTMLAPNIMSDVDGRYRGMDNKIHKMERGNMYTVYSLWDTFRALHPLYTVIDPNKAQDFIRALLIKYKESGLLPVWELASNETNCMIGYHAVPVIADAFNKGQRDFDTALALEASVKSGMQDHLGMADYKVQGYVPADKENESASRTLEYAYDDWCIAGMAKELNDKNKFEYFSKRAQNYKNVYDTTSGFMRGKKNGNWVSPFEPSEVSGIYTEANAWQYTWFAPHDVDGMISLMGGKKKFEERLNTLFTTSPDLKGRSQPDISGMIGQYAHGNEPSHHMVYLYNWTDAPHRTSELVHKIMKEFYTNNRDGLIGNEDCGQMSAWYVFSAMGFYPVCPGKPEYSFGSPLFSKITIGEGTGTKFIIVADSVSERNIYLKEVLWNGQKQSGILQHSQIASGGTLQMQLTSIPTGLTHTPGEEKNLELISTPFLISGEKAFVDSCKIEMNCYIPGTSIRYTTDGSEPATTSNEYISSFYIDQSTNFKIRAFKEGMIPSFTETASFLKIPYKRKISYTNMYSHLYTAGGMNGLIDGLHGIPEVFGGWQGFQGMDMEVVIDLMEVRSFTKINATFLQQYPSWIWLPEEVTYSVSDDAENFKEISKIKNDVSLEKPESFIKNFKAEFPPVNSRYVKVVAKNIKACPPWHPGAGDKAWIFADEINIE